MDICSKLITIWGLIITALGMVFMVTIFIGFDQVWEVIKALNDGAGAMLGAFLGLLAILAGALYNAKLNRDRDDRLLLQERKALAAGLKGELMVLGMFLKSQARINRNVVQNVYKDLDDELTESEIDFSFKFKGEFFKNNAGNIGLLGAKSTFCLTSINESLSNIVNTDKYSFNLNENIDRAELLSINYQTLINIIDETIKILEDIDNGLDTSETDSLPNFASLQGFW